MLNPCLKNVVIISALVSASVGFAASPIELSNEQLAIRFDSANAALVDFSTGEGLRLAGGAMGPIDVLADSAWRFSNKTDENCLHVRNYRLEQAEGLKRLTFDCAAPGWGARIVYELPDSGAWFRRRAQWKYVGQNPALVESVRFYLPNVCIDQPDDCVYTLPSLWPPRDIAFRDLTDGRILATNMWNSVPPAVVVYNQRRRIGLTAAFFTTQESFEILAREHPGHIDIENRLRVVAEMRPGQTINLGDEYFAVTRGDMLDAIRACKEIYELAGFRHASRAKWTYGASLYSLPPGGSQTSGGSDLGGFKNFRTYILPRLQRLGFDIIWFLPTNPGGYAPTDYFTTNSAFGSLDDLRELSDEAHRRGLRIFLDLIPHGPQEHSHAGRDILPAHDHWVMRDRKGSMKYRWGCLACDYAQPEWQDYMARVAALYLKRCDIDGWRVDVAGGWSPNWRPAAGLRPSQSSPYGALALLQKSRNEMQKLKPDVAILGEIGSWLFLQQCDFIYDWSFQRTLRDLVKMRPKRWTPLVQESLERQQAALPEGAESGLMRFLENHDQWKAVWNWGPGQHRALLSLCALTPGLPLVFSDEDVGFGEHIRWLNDLRARLAEVAKGRAIYTATKCAAPSVVAFARVADRGFSVIAINFGAEQLRTTVRLPLKELGLPQDAPYCQRGLTTLDQPPSSRPKGRIHALPPLPLRESNELTLSLSPYDTRVIVFRPEGEAFPYSPPRLPPQTEIQISRPRATNEADCVVVDDGAYSLKLKDGLIREFRSVREGAPLIAWMNVVEGRRKVWPGRRLDFAREVRAAPKIEETGNGVAVSFEGTIQRGDSLAIPWRASYRCERGKPIEVEWEIAPPRSPLPVCGELRLELQFPYASAWTVDTFAGALEDEFAVVHPLGDLMRGWKYWHRSGLLWEAAQLPTGLTDRTICARVGDTWVNVGLPRFLSGFENAYLRERDSRGRRGLTLCLALLDQKGATRFDHPLRARFVLQCAGRPGSPSPLKGEGWTFKAEGANYIFKNEHYELVLGKSRGGGIFGFRPAGAAEPVIDAANIYSDRGIYADAKTPDGRTVKESGAASIDYETDSRLWQEGQALVVEFQGFFRSRYRPRNVASPRVQYRLRYRFDASPRVGVECAARPLISAKGLRAFVAQTLTLPHARSWRVKLAGGEASAAFEQKRGKRVWESVELPLGADSEIEILGADGRIKFSEIHAPASDVQNVFLLDAGGGSAVMFFAFFSGIPTDYSPSWREVSYVLEAQKR